MCHPVFIDNLSSKHHSNGHYQLHIVRRISALCVILGNFYYGWEVFLGLMIEIPNSTCLLWQHGVEIKDIELTQATQIHDSDFDPSLAIETTNDEAVIVGNAYSEVFVQVKATLRQSSAHGKDEFESLI